MKLDGFNHAAVITGDLDALVAFYTEVFDAQEVFRGEIPMDPAAPPIRHCLLRVGDRALLHPVELPGHEAGRAVAQMFQRGHIDHLGLNVESREDFDEARRRLAAAGATDGEVTDLGHQWSLFFTDPDGMQAEVCWIHEPTFSAIHDPVLVELPLG